MKSVVSTLARWWIAWRRRVDISLLTILTAAVIITGIFTITKDSSAVCLLLILPILLLAWVRGPAAGLFVAGVAAILTAPYGIEPLIEPKLELFLWMPLVVCYLALGALIGMWAAASRQHMHAIMTEMEEKLERAQASAVHYEALLIELNEGQERLRRMNEELALLNTLATAVNSSLNATQVQETAMLHISTLLDVDEVQIYWRNFQVDTFVLQGARPMTEDEIAKVVPVPANDGIFGRLLQNQHTIAINELGQGPQMLPHSMSSEVKSMIAVPMRSRSRVLGVLVLGRKSGQHFSDDDQKFLEAVARVLTVAIENAKLFEHAQELSLSDELTGLANRRMFNLRLEAEVTRVKMLNTPLCLVFFDLDFFKQVNDRHGHPAGDEVLRQFAARVQQDIRSTDLFCRTGGEEFGLLTTDTSLPITVTIAERICHHIEQNPFILEDGTVCPMTVSAGVACVDESISNADDLVAAADRSLYAAKTGGRNCVKIFHPDFAELPVLN